MTSTASLDDDDEVLALPLPDDDDDVDPPPALQNAAIEADADALVAPKRRREQLEQVCIGKSKKPRHMAANGAADAEAEDVRTC